MVPIQRLGRPTPIPTALVALEPGETAVQAGLAGGNAGFLQHPGDESGGVTVTHLEKRRTIVPPPVRHQRGDAPATIRTLSTEDLAQNRSAHLRIDEVW